MSAGGGGIRMDCVGGDEDAGEDGRGLSFFSLARLAWRRQGAWMSEAIAIYGRRESESGRGG